MAFRLLFGIFEVLLSHVSVLGEEHLDHDIQRLIKSLRNSFLNKINLNIIFVYSPVSTLSPFQISPSHILTVFGRSEG